MPGSMSSSVDATLFGSHHVAAKKRLAKSASRTSVHAAGIVAASDVERIKMSASTAARQQAVDPRALREESLRAMSQARTTRWPNTIEAQLKKKDSARNDRLLAEEALRIAIDKEEETFKAEQRRLAIERANKMLYDQTDRVKALHTSMHVAEIEAVRNEQVAFKGRMKALEKRRDARFHEQQQDMLRKLDAEEDERDAEDHARRMEERRLREAQVALKHAEYADKVETIKREGELMRAKAAEDWEAERRMQSQRTATEKAAREESMKLNDDLKELKKQEAIVQAAADEKMHRYATAKEAMLLGRQAREKERFAAKQAIRQRMIDAQTERLARMQQSNDTILNRQVAELQASELAAQKARHAKTRADLVATHISRQQQLKWKADARKQEQLETEHFASQLGALNERLRSEEHAKVAHDRAERARLDDFHFGQMAHKQALELAEIEDEAHETAHVQQYLEDEEAIFQQYAKMCTAEMQEKGKSTRPIEVLLSKKEKLSN